MIEIDRAEFLSGPESVPPDPWGVLVAVGFNEVRESEVERARKHLSIALSGEFCRLGFRRFAGVYAERESDLGALLSQFEADREEAGRWRFAACRCQSIDDFGSALHEAEWRASKAARYESGEVFQQVSLDGAL